MQKQILALILGHFFRWSRTQPQDHCNIPNRCYIYCKNFLIYSFVLSCFLRKLHHKILLCVLGNTSMSCLKLLPHLNDVFVNGNLWVKQEITLQESFWHSHCKSIKHGSCCVWSGNCYSRIGSSQFPASFQPCDYPHFIGRWTIIRKPAIMVVMILLDLGYLKARRIGLPNLATWATWERKIRRAFHDSL